MNKNTQLVTIIIVAIIVIGGGYCLFAMPSAPASVATEPVATTTAVTPATPTQNTPTTYSNPELGFSFVMPSGWKVQETGGTEGSNQWVFFSNGGRTYVFQILITLNGAQDTLVSLRQADEMQGYNSDFATTTVGGEPAFTYISYPERGSLDITTAVHDGMEYDFTGPVPTSFTFLK